MGMFKYSSEVVPTQTLQLNTMKVCLYVFETHNLKLPSTEQEAILSSCKNNSSRFFFPFHTEMNLTNFKALFGKVWNTSTPCSHSQWLEHATGRCKKLKDVSVGFPHPCVRCGYFAVWKSLFLPQSSQTSAYIPADCFQSAGASHRTEKMVVFCGKGLVFWRAWGWENA